MQKLGKFDALYRPEIECKCLKDNPEKAYFTRNVCKFPEFLIWKMSFAFLLKIL